VTLIRKKGNQEHDSYFLHSAMITAQLIQVILKDYSLPWDGTHGPPHWGRALENGLCLAEQTGADISVVSLFAVLHDCRRVNEGEDSGHGLRAAEFAVSIRGAALGLDNSRFELLHFACAHHTDGLTDGDITVQTCWDADRLDLGRVGINPHPQYLCTESAKEPGMITWADDHARNGHIPSVVDSWRSESEIG
jgi:uncharacterized protein